MQLGGKKITKDVRDAKLNSWREKMNSWGFRSGADNINSTPGGNANGSGEALEEIMLMSGNPSPEKLMMSASAGPPSSQ